MARRSCRSKCVATAVHGQQHEAAVVHTHRFPSYAIALDLTAPAYTAVKASHLQRRWHSNQSRPLTRPSGPTRTMCIRNCLMVLPAGKDCVPMRAPARAWPPLSPARRRRVRGSPASFVRKRTDMRMEAGLHQAERGGRRVGPRGSWLLASRQCPGRPGRPARELCRSSRPTRPNAYQRAQSAGANEVGPPLERVQAPVRGRRSLPEFTLAADPVVAAAVQSKENTLCFR